MTNLTNALNLLTTTPDPESVFVLQSGLPYEPESWGVIGVYASQLAAEAAAATVKSPMETEITPYLVEDVPWPSSEGTQPTPINVFYRSWSGTEYPTLESIPWQSRGSAVAVLAE